MNTKAKIDEKSVINWLEENPDIFQQHPQLLEIIELRHSNNSNTSSLIERQVSRLRVKNLDIARKIHQMTQNALENEDLMGKLHSLSLALGETESLGDFFQLLRDELKNRFNADYVYIGLFADKLSTDDQLPLSILQPDNQELNPFHTVLEGGQTSCGRLAHEKLQFLFGRDNPIRSTALVPIGKQGRYGMLAIGSENPGKFFPGMGTMFLELLSETISHRLAKQEAVLQRLSA
ncbi:MAG: DUF484 family protein [Xanthomonadales bacterium]|nr:DUF484 family protein [Xanthomonadales bacterium]